MKKLLSALLALIMVVSILPVTFATETDAEVSGVSVKYHFKSSYNQSTGFDLTSYQFNNTNGFWEGIYVYDAYGKVSTARSHLNSGAGLFLRNKGCWAVLKINIPTSGVYNKLTIYTSADTSSTTDLDIYLADKDMVFSDSFKPSSLEPLAENINFYALYEKQNAVYTNTFEVPISQYFESGEHCLVFYIETGKGSDLSSNTSQAKIYHLTISGGNGISPIITSATAPESLVAGETSNITATVSSLLSDAATAAGNVTFTYASSDDSVAKISVDGTITAVAEGTAEITVSATSDAAKATSPATRKVTLNVSAPKSETSPKTSLWIGDNIDGKNVSVTINGETKESETLLSETRGLNVCAVANTPEGYVFRGWVRGSAEHGVWVSSNPEYTFITTTHSMLTAVFEEIVEGDIVEYYNENGAYIETRSASDAAPTFSEVPVLTGHIFDDWYVGENIKLSDAVLGKLTRAVAKHTPINTNATISSNGTLITSTEFNSEIRNTGSSDTTCWKRNGEIIAYGKDYTYYVWGDTEIESCDESLPATKQPIIYLDPIANTNGARMIEYDKGDYEIVEVGILFGDSGKIPEVTSCTEKMNSQRNSNHGQFTAIPSDASYSARGYMIYLDGTEYKVIYSK